METSSSRARRGKGACSRSRSKPLRAAARCGPGTRRAPAFRPGSRPDQPAWKVLIVDDVPTNRDLLDELLSRMGFSTRTAASGEEAIVMHDEWRPDLVLMDVRMPGMGGLEAIRQAAGRAGRRPRSSRSRASGLADTEGEAREAGVDAFVRKPYREGELLAAIGERLGVRYLYASSGPRPSVAAPRRRRAIDAVAAIEQPAAGADRSVARGGDRGPRQAARSRSRIRRGNTRKTSLPRFGRWPGTSSTTRSCRRCHRERAMTPETAADAGAESGSGSVRPACWSLTTRSTTCGCCRTCWVSRGTTCAP